MEQSKPHEIVVPMPGQGHINPIMNLAKLLHTKGFYITFVITEIVHNRWLHSKGINSLIDGSSSTFRFVTIPNELDYENDEYSGDPQVWIKAIKNNLVAPFRELVSRLNNEASDSSDGRLLFPPISCIVSDGLMSFTLDVAQELGIPTALVFIVSACCVLAYALLHQLIEKGFVLPKVMNANQNLLTTTGHLEAVIECIPGMEGIQVKHMPSFFGTTDPDDGFIHFILDEMERAHKANIIVMNTFQALEAKVFDGLKSIYPQISTIGPLHLMENRLTQDNEASNYSCPTLYKEDNDDYLKWLDSKPPDSVIFISFGSTHYTTAEQVIEFAYGLANTKQNFLWILREDLVGGVTAVIPSEIEMEIKDMGVIASWCDQKSVLNHPAICGFLTHCGWNSVLESICAGVPMILWPIFGDQPLYCWLCSRLGIGIELDSEVKRENVEKLVKELMAGEKGKKMKEKVMEWKVYAEAASSIGGGGSSYENFEKMVQVLQSKN